MAKPTKIDNIYPATPGVQLRLGDYGVFSKDGFWNHIGNIQELPGNPKSFSIREDVMDDNWSKFIEVSLEGKADAKVDVNDLKTGGKLKFNKKNSLLWLANIKKRLFYASLDREIEPLLKELSEQGYWKDEYLLAWSIYYSDNFLICQSKNGGCSVELSTDISFDAWPSQVAGINAFLSNNRASIDSLSSFGDQLQYIGANLLAYKSRLWLFPPKISFQGLSQDELFISSDC